MSRFIHAAFRRKVDATPVWLVRQTGRSLPEHRKLRERWTLAEIEGRPSRSFEKVKIFHTQTPNEAAPQTAESSMKAPAAR